MKSIRILFLNYKVNLNKNIGQWAKRWLAIKVKIYTKHYKNSH